MAFSESYPVHPPEGDDLFASVQRLIGAWIANGAVYGPAEMDGWIPVPPDFDFEPDVMRVLAFVEVAGTGQIPFEDEGGYGRDNFWGRGCRDYSHAMCARALATCDPVWFVEALRSVWLLRGCVGLTERLKLRLAVADVVLCMEAAGCTRAELMPALRRRIGRWAAWRVARWLRRFRRSKEAAAWIRIGRTRDGAPRLEKWNGRSPPE